jgi:nitrite reductase (NADH) large subunit
MGVYRKFLLQQGRLAGCVLVGDTSGALFYLGLIRSGQDISAIRADLPFGENYCVREAA